MKKLVLTAGILAALMVFVAAPVAARGPVWGFPTRGYTPPPPHQPTPPVVHTPTPTPPPAPQPQPANPLICGGGFSTQYGNANVNVTSGGVHVVLSTTNTSYSLNIDDGAAVFSNYHTSIYYNHNGCSNDEVRIAGNNQAQTAGFNLYARNNNGVYTFTLTTWGSVPHYSLNGVTSGTIKVVPLTYY